MLNDFFACQMFAVFHVVNLISPVAILVPVTVAIVMTVENCQIFWSARLLEGILGDSDVMLFVYS